MIIIDHSLKFALVNFYFVDFLNLLPGIERGPERVHKAIVIHDTIIEGLFLKLTLLPMERSLEIL